jgi:hypothetical protein
VVGKQFWLGPACAGVMVTFWADTDVIHLLSADTQIETMRSHLSVGDLAALADQGGRPAGPSPLPPVQPGEAVKVEPHRQPETLIGRACQQPRFAQRGYGRWTPGGW